MDYAPSEITALTDDEYELDVLTPDRAAIVEPDDPMYVEIAQLSHQISHYRQKLPHGQKKAAHLAVSTLTNTEIAERTGVSQLTVAKLRKNPHFKMISSLQERINRLNAGPDLAQRSAMMWRIAKREELDAPTTSLKALDLLNKQEGVYMSEDKNAGGNTTITVTTLNFGLEGKPLEDLRDITPKVTTIDKAAGFVPLKINIPNEE